jgi:hypothetical protein
MKKYLTIILFLMLAGNYAYSQGSARITFVNKDSVYDFGSLQNGDGGQYRFEIKNTGTEDLSITNVRSDNEHLRFQWPPKNLKPGKKGAIIVSYIPKDGDDNGSFNNDVFVTSNAASGTNPLIHISGAIVPAGGGAMKKESPSSKQHFPHSAHR